MTCEDNTRKISLQSKAYLPYKAFAARSLKVFVLLFSKSKSDYNRLIEACFFGEFPYNRAAAAGEQKVCKLVSAGSAVFALESADLRCAAVVDDVLNESVTVVVPFPRLERNALTAVGFVDIWRRIGRF